MTFLTKQPREHRSAPESQLCSTFSQAPPQLSGSTGPRHTPKIFSHLVPQAKPFQVRVRKERPATPPGENAGPA